MFHKTSVVKLMINTTQENKARSHAQLLHIHYTQGTHIKTQEHTHRNTLSYDM